MGLTGGRFDLPSGAAAQRPARLVIFDVDGTLADSQHNIVEAQRRAFASLGLAAPTREASLSVVGLSLAESFAELVGPSGPVRALAEAYKEAWLAMRGEPGFREPLYPGAAELVETLAAKPGVGLGLATGKSRKGVARLLGERNWSGAFATIQTADDHPSKPAPAMLLAALAETGVSRDDAVFVGDTTFDARMARAAGIAFVGVAWGYHPAARLLAEGAAAVAKDFSELGTMLGAGPPAR